MPQLDMYDKTGKTVGTIDLKPEIFEVPVMESHIHMAVIRQLADKRVGTACTKTRGEVRGGGRKPWKQKGTGRARHGSSRSPIWKGGGVTFGPRPRDYSKSMNRKMRRLVLKEALSSKVSESTFTVVDNITMDAISTKAFVEIMANLKVNGKTLFVLKDSDDAVRKSGRNIKDVKVVRPDGVSVYDLVYFENVVFDKSAVAQLEEVLA